MDRGESVYWAGRAALVRRPEDIAVFDRIFDSYWLGRLAAEPAASIETVTVGLDDTPDDDGVDGDGGDAEPQLSVRFSAVETLRTRDFAEYTADEWAEARHLITALRLGGELRRARRQQRTRRPSGRPDLRRTVRRALRTGGVPVERAWTAPSQRRRPVVLLVDISGSMDPYARALLRFAHAAMVGRAGRRVEVFSLGTRLTRLTRELSRRDPDAAMADAARAVQDWSGGTRLGAALQEFNDRWGTRGMARGAVVVILSDGWDRGDPAVLAEEMGRLARVAHRVVWVNPLKASAGYAPLARGMAAALPYVDDFVEGHSLDSLERLAAVVGHPGGVEQTRRGGAG
jgi:uncharacterized protein with von Willebrand factor type A (vWA) domain